MQITEVEHKNGNITYTVSGYLGLDGDNGKPINTKRRGFRSPQAAVEAWVKLKKEFNDNDQKLKVNVKPPRVNDIYLEYIEWYRPQVEPSTFIKTEELFRNHILPFFGEYFVDRVSNLDAQNFTDEIFNKLVNAKSVCNYARALFQEAFRLGYVQENVFTRVRYPLKHISSSPLVEQNYYTKKELELFLDALDKNIQDCHEKPRRLLEAHRTRAFLRLLVMTGLRREEALALREDSFNFYRNIVTVKSAIKYAKCLYEGSTKSKSGVRTVQVDSVTLDYVLKYFEYRHSYFVEHHINISDPNHYAFTANISTKLMSFAQPRKMMVSLCQKYDLRRITVHGLRHTQATLLYAAGAKDIDVATRLGHSDANITRQVYVHESQDIADKAFGILNSYLSSK